MPFPEFVLGATNAGGAHQSRWFTCLELIQGSLLEGSGEYGRPSIFSGSFQEAALYQFQTGKPSGLVSTAGVRRTQYELWKRHAEWQQKSVVVFGAEGPQAQWLSIGHRGIGYLISDHLQSSEGDR